ncbi:YbaB/EbfC family nucleoid-associated protein [Actinoplanes oblitus]|uniref:YbaB/EbfC family nucleoid-associated protein n=1 Tax=Actinoplanes oblitus TaxID=3040509 RepID=A0ABY8WC59_9ACTN|nr:YbaB/EbfC family nucleoid-associated protein [Actinoplanes oblitus]WIM94505.1 YbaB/EbfC family nucleoid-associated protein [Actinoplanes oblitus]
MDESENWIDDWQEGIEARLARTRDFANRLGEMKGSARSGGGLVEVTVDSSGALNDLYLDDGVRRHSGRWIAEQVLSATRSARAELVRQADLVAQQSGAADTAEGRALLTALTARLRDGGQ